MSSVSKRISLLILGVTSLLTSRVIFFFINDPEGPNLVVVTGLALIIYLLTFGAFSFLPLSGIKRLLLTICIQIIIVAVLYLLLS
jgi:hypothetical protein